MSVEDTHAAVAWKFVDSTTPYETIIEEDPDQRNGSDGPDILNSVKSWAASRHSRTVPNVTGSRLVWDNPAAETAELKSEVLDGAVESIEGSMALVVFKTPGGFLERYVDAKRLESKQAAFPGARIRLIVRRSGVEDAVTSEILNASSDLPPAWAKEDKEFDELFRE